MCHYYHIVEYKYDNIFTITSEIYSGFYDISVLLRFKELPLILFKKRFYLFTERERERECTCEPREVEGEGEILKQIPH